MKALAIPQRPTVWESQSSGTKTVVCSGRPLPAPWFPLSEGMMQFGEVICGGMAGTSGSRMADVAANGAPPRYFRVRFVTAMFTSSCSENDPENEPMSHFSHSMRAPIMTTCLLMCLAAAAVIGNGTDAGLRPEASRRPA
jgi:hypothetical protein